MELTTPDQFLTRLRTLPKGTRSLVGIAGPPGAGKSTSVEALAEALNGERPERAAILPMDGYHFDDAVLEARGDRVVKGAPHTFDVGGLTAMLDRLRLNLDDATERAEQNDLPNGLRVLQDSQSADLEIDGTLSISAAST